MEEKAGSENKNMEFLQKNLWYIIAGIVVIIIVALAITSNRNKDAQKTAGGNQNNEQTASENTANPQPQNQNTNTPQNVPANMAENLPVVTNSGNVSAIGTLKTSDNTAKANLMVESNKGKIYIATKRNFSSLLGQQVTLQAEGTINKFVFLGFAESSTGSVAGTDTTAKGGGEEVSGNVKFTGTLMNSDTTAKGNYTIASGNTKVYLKTVRDYSAWVGSQVELRATGTINSFTNAILNKK